MWKFALMLLVASAAVTLALPLLPEQTEEPMSETTEAVTNQNNDYTTTSPEQTEAPMSETTEAVTNQNNDYTTSPEQTEAPMSESTKSVNYEEETIIFKADWTVENHDPMEESYAICPPPGSYPDFSD